MEGWRIRVGGKGTETDSDRDREKESVRDGGAEDPRAQAELDLPLYSGLEEPPSLIGAGELWKPPLGLGQ